MLNLELGNLLLVIIIHIENQKKKYSQKVFNTLASLKNHKNFNFIQVTENKEYREEDRTNQIKQESLSLVKEKINSS